MKFVLAQYERRISGIKNRVHCTERVRFKKKTILCVLYKLGSLDALI